jgi:hypothetical protein
MWMMSDWGPGVRVYDRLNILFKDSIDGRKRLPEKHHVGCDLTLKVIVQDLSALHSSIQRKAGYVPAPNNEVIGMYHRKDVRNGDMDFLA